jgi:hypothetical protein
MDTSEFPIQKFAFFRKIKDTGDPPEGWGVQAQRGQIKELRGDVHAVRRTSDSAD